MAKKSDSLKVDNPESDVTTVEPSSVEFESEDCTRDVRKFNNDSGNACTINVEGSAVIVGTPLTHVTIYQNINPTSDQSTRDKVVHGAAAKPTGDCSPEKQPSSTIKFISTPHKKRLVIYTTIILIMLILIVLSIVLSLSAAANDSDSNNNIDEAGQGNIVLGKSVMFTRNQWGGRPPLNFTKPLSHPTEFVVISHTAGKYCTDFSPCSQTVQAIQRVHVDNSGSPDIGYNFLIGGDGNIYVGRGWDIKNFHDDHNIGISFIGNYLYDQLTAKMISALEALLNQGVVLQKLSSDYKLVCHNQTYATLSPGANVYNEMAKLPHFIPGVVIIA